MNQEDKLFDLLDDFVSLIDQTHLSFDPPTVPPYGLPPVIVACLSWPNCVDPNCNIC